ncbi:MAG: hypothetical protein ACE5IY_22275 [bacterium]
MSSPADARSAKAAGTYARPMEKPLMKLNTDSDAAIHHKRESCPLQAASPPEMLIARGMNNMMEIDRSLVFVVYGSHV